MKKTLLFCALLTIISCKQANKPNTMGAVAIAEATTEVSEPESTPFLESVSKINSLAVPLTFYCGAEAYTWVSKYGEEIEKRAPQQYGEIGVVGKLPIENDKIYIIYGRVGDMIYPKLYTYNHQGQLIDSIDLHLGYFCGADDAIDERCYTTINRDFSIAMVDTSVHLHYVESDSGYQQIIDSTTVAKRNFELGTNGLYSIVDEQRIKIE